MSFTVNFSASRPAAPLPTPNRHVNGQGHHRGVPPRGK
jgi:hypothetical protein